MPTAQFLTSCGFNGATEDKASFFDNSVDCEVIDYEVIEYEVIDYEDTDYELIPDGPVVSVMPSEPESYAGDLARNFHKANTRLYTHLGHVDPCPEFINVWFQKTCGGFVEFVALEVVEVFLSTLEAHFHNFIEPYLRPAPGIHCVTQVQYLTSLGNRVSILDTPATVALRDGDYVYVRLPPGAL